MTTSRPTGPGAVTRATLKQDLKVAGPTGRAIDLEAALRQLIDSLAASPLTPAADVAVRAARLLLGADLPGGVDRGASANPSSYAVAVQADPTTRGAPCGFASGAAMVPVIAVLAAIAYDLPWPSLLLPIRMPPRPKPGSVQHRFHEAARVALHVARGVTDLHPSVIGAMIGRRDRTAVLHAAKAVAEWRSVDPRLAALVAVIECRARGTCEQFPAGCEQLSPAAIHKRESYEAHTNRLAAIEIHLEGAMGSMTWPAGGTPANATQGGYQGLEIVSADADRLTKPDLIAAPLGQPEQTRWVYATGSQTLWQQIGLVSNSPANWINLSAGTALTAEPNEVVHDQEYVNAAYRQWLNDTGGDLTVPAVITAASMETAGFTDVTAGVTNDRLTVAGDVITFGGQILTIRRT